MMKGQWYAKKWVAISLHVLFWALFFISPYLLRPVMDENTSHHFKANTSHVYYLIFLNNFFGLMLFYANAFVFMPKLGYRKRYGFYLLVLAVSLATMLFWDYCFFIVLIKGIPYKVWNFFVFNLPFFCFIIACSTAFRMIRDRIKETQLAREKENENLKTELSLLRSQVSPHFMFNIMNNMVALARKKSELLEPSLIKLSSLLRYMLYETEDRVPLQKEIEYLQSYIDLQSQRYGSKVAIKSFMENITDLHEIEPMLLIPFVENAFKHGTGLIENPEIDIHLRTERNLLYFSVRNKFTDLQEVKDKSSGIGLVNVQRRLDLLYGNKHSLLITKQDNWFVVSLQIMLH